MSATEILEELPNLSAAELETIYRRAMELRHGQMVEPTPQLPAAEREKKPRDHEGPPDWLNAGPASSGYPSLIHRTRGSPI